MNTSNIKKVAPKARTAFMEAVANRLNNLGLYADKEPAEATLSGELFQVNGRSFDKSLLASRNKLKDKITASNFLIVTEEVAYTWFNRFCAIRYMELHDDFFEHGIRILSHPSQEQAFESIDKAVELAKELEVSATSLDSISDMKMAGNQDEAIFRQLLLDQCHYLHKAMPFMFEAINDESELLLPENLTRTDSILRPLIDEIPEQDWEEIEVIGWLYQFYISEKKDEVIGKVVKSEDIPAATQLFTPNWIVKYLVQNSLGAKWLASYPESEIKSEMEYYIEPAEQTDEVKQQLADITPDSLNIEEITLIDPACGSGHILVEAYDLFKAIYQTQGYRVRDIPQLILEKNLFGLDIDGRAAQLSSFALMMKAREDDRRIFTRGVELNVVKIVDSKQWTVDNFAPLLPTLDTQEQQGLRLIIKDLLECFKQADNLGSLIDVPDNVVESLPTLERITQEVLESGDLFSTSAAEDLQPLIKQAQILSRKYDAVVANPPYMGCKYQTLDVKKYLKDNFNGYEKDLFSAFIVRNLQLSKKGGQLGFMTPFVWMFISSYEQLRSKLINDEMITSLIQLEYSGFDGATVPICTFTLQKGHTKNFTGSFIKLSDFKGATNQSPKTLEAIKNRNCGWFYTTKQDDFRIVPGSPISYWVSDNFRNAFTNGNLLKDISIPRQGLATMDNTLFTREWFEVSLNNFSPFSHIEKKWFPYNKGGDFRRWYGNQEVVVNWKNSGSDIKKLAISRYGSASKRVVNEQSYFKPSITWSKISSSKPSFRYQPEGAIFDVAGMSIFPENKKDFDILLSCLNSIVTLKILQVLSPTLNFEAGQISAIPVLQPKINISEFVDNLKNISKIDWDMYETSWEFLIHPLIYKNDISTLSLSFRYWLDINQNLIKDTLNLEEKINNIYLDLYSLHDEISPKVPIEQITLTVNPKYRYGTKLSDEELANRFQSDTLSELISYSIGCMMGRYSLDREGLVYAHSSNEGFKELESEGAYKTFPADDDGIIPLTDETWFDDDATNRFKEFLITVWGNDTLEENLQFVADSLCLYALKSKKNESALDTVRRYFTTGFYKQHLKTYKKRPIYWLFSSGKQKAFECLVYLHRYNEATLSRMRTEYVTPLLGKFEAQQQHTNDQITNASSTAEANKYKKSLTALEKKQSELREFDDKLKHYADMQIKLDLDDGVKVNYGKFGDLLANVKEVTGEKPVVLG